MRIRANDPVREAYADRSTGNGRGKYYETKGHAVHAFEGALKEHGYCFDPNELFDLPNDTGHRNLAVQTGQGEDAGYAVFYWYRMPSGRYECVSYLA